MQGAQVRSLVGELRSHVPLGVAKKKRYAHGSYKIRWWVRFGLQAKCADPCNRELWLRAGLGVKQNWGRVLAWSFLHKWPSTRCSTSMSLDFPNCKVGLIIGLTFWLFWGLMEITPIKCTAECLGLSKNSVKFMCLTNIYWVVIVGQAVYQAGGVFFTVLCLIELKIQWGWWKQLVIVIINNAWALWKKSENCKSLGNVMCYYYVFSVFKNS